MPRFSVSRLQLILIGMEFSLGGPTTEATVGKMSIGSTRMTMSWPVTSCPVIGFGSGFVAKACMIFIAKAAFFSAPNPGCGLKWNTKATGLVILSKSCHSKVKEIRLLRRSVRFAGIARLGSLSICSAVPGIKCFSGSPVRNFVRRHLWKTKSKPPGVTQNWSAEMKSN